MLRQKALATVAEHARRARDAMAPSSQANDMQSSLLQNLKTDLAEIEAMETQYAANATTPISQIQRQQAPLRKKLFTARKVYAPTLARSALYAAEAAYRPPYTGELATGQAALDATLVLRTVTDAFNSIESQVPKPMDISSASRQAVNNALDAYQRLQSVADQLRDRLAALALASQTESQASARHLLVLEDMSANPLAGREHVTTKVALHDAIESRKAAAAARQESDAAQKQALLDWNKAKKKAKIMLSNGPVL